VVEGGLLAPRSARGGLLPAAPPLTKQRRTRVRRTKARSRVGGEDRACIGASEAGPDTDVPFEIADYWITRYFEWMGYTYYPASLSTKPDGAKLADRGWFRKWRVPSLLDPNRRPPMPKVDPLEHDPVAMAVRSVRMYRTLVLAPGELLEAASRMSRQSNPGTVDPPTNPRELHDHLVKIARPLQARRLFVDEERMFFFIERYWTLPRDTSKYSRYGYLITEYWENAKTGEGLWAFTAFRSGRNHQGGANARSLWQKVKVLEKVAEDLDEPLRHRLYKKEGTELRETIEIIAPADKWSSSGG
jgi:hypothetical protein